MNRFLVIIFPLFIRKFLETQNIFQRSWNNFSRRRGERHRLTPLPTGSIPHYIEWCIHKDCKYKSYRNSVNQRSTRLSRTTSCCIVCLCNDPQIFTERVPLSYDLRRVERALKKPNSACTTCLQTKRRKELSMCIIVSKNVE